MIKMAVPPPHSFFLSFTLTLDVRNAFNSTRWELVMSELERREVLAYLLNIVSSYFHRRQLLIKENI